MVFLENEIMYNERMVMSDEAMSDNFLLPIGKAKIERAGMDLLTGWDIVPVINRMFADFSVGYLSVLQAVGMRLFWDDPITQGWELL